MNVVFINGWGIAKEAALKAFAGRTCFHSTEIIQPIPGWEGRLRSLSGSGDLLLAYSTGAFLLLGRPELAKGFSRKMLLAPFVDFRAEANLGGKTRAVQLEVLLRRLSKDPCRAIEDFYERAGIQLPCPPDDFLPVEELQWGIRQLAEISLSPSRLDPFEVFIGENDPLIDAKRIHKLHSNTRLLSGLGHDLNELLRGVFE